MPGDGSARARYHHCPQCDGPPKAFAASLLKATKAPCPDCGHALADHATRGCNVVPGICMHGSIVRRVRRRCSCACPRRVRVTTKELDAWVAPIWDAATTFFGVKGWAKYAWYNGTSLGRCTLWDPAGMGFSRPHFRRFMLEDDAREAGAVMVHELLHGLGLNHDKRIGWSLSTKWRLDYELVGRVFEGKPASDDVRKVFRRISKAAHRRQRIYCAGTTREHRIGASGETCQHCGVAVAAVRAREV